LPEIDDANGDGVLNDADEGVAPGVKYEYSYWPQFVLIAAINLTH